MVETKRFLSVFILLILAFSGINHCLNAEELGEITLQASSQPELKVSDKPSVFLPSKLIIGQDNIFIVKGTPGSKVSLAISKANRGSNPLMGNPLRLGETEKTIEGVISPTGAVQLIYPLPDDDSLVEQIRYFEVAIWKNDDFSDLSIATTISPSGKETRNNGIKISLPPESGKSPSFSPVIPGLGQDIMRSIEHVKAVQDKSINPELIDDGETPAYLDSVEKRDLMLQNIDEKDLGR
ncbi:MAG: hypothetical protein AB1782_06845 [Cyanobacteriota bacterium]